MSASSLTYDDWDALEHKEKIKYFLLGGRRVDRTFESMADSFLAVIQTNSQIELLLEEQDKWIIKDIAKKNSEKKKKSHQRDCYDSNQDCSDDDSYFDPYYDQISLDPYGKKILMKQFE